MENTEKIVFLYDEKSIPDQIIEAAKAQTPSGCLLYTSPSPRDATLSRMPSSA